MDYDQYKSGQFESDSPINSEPTEVEQITIDEWYYYDLKEDSQKLRDLKYKIKLLIEIAEPMQNIFITNKIKDLLK
jgi:hypothetical protein